MQSRLQLVVTVVIVCFALTPLVDGAAKFSTDPKKKGLEIAVALDKLDEGFSDQKANLQMILKDRKGRTSTRTIRSQTLEVKGDGDKTLIVFDDPRTVKGTKFLSFTHKKGPDDQWLFLPKLKRVKRIASNNKSGPFVGSEFAYEDIASQEVEKYTYKFVKDEACGALKCHVVERYPVDKNSGYTRQLVWIVQGEGEYRPVRIEYYDRKKAHLKTLTLEGYKKHLDRYWRSEKMHMDNHATGKATTLVWSDYKFKSGLDKRDFNQSALKRSK